MDGVNLARLDLNLLVTLDALLRHGGVTAAARELHLSQPATSRALERLREQIGDPLLVRAGRGLVPTDRARALAGPVAEALAAASRVFAPPPDFDPATATGELSIGLGDEAQVAFADAILAEIWAGSPGVDVRVRTLTERSLDEGRRGELDLALGPDLGALPRIAGDVAYDDFVARPLYLRRFVVAARPGRLPGGLDLPTFLAASHVIVSFSGGGVGFVDELLARQGQRRRVAASVTGFLSAARVAATTDLLATLPEEVVRTAQPELQVYPPPLPLPELPMLLLWHPRRGADPRHRHLREAVARAVRRRVAGWSTGEGSCKMASALQEGAEEG